MSARSLLAALVAVAVVATAALLLFYMPGGDAVVDATHPTPAPAASDQAAQPAAAQEAVADDAANATTDERTAAAPAATPPGPLTHVTGRCVDAAGAPLAGCKVHMQGWGAGDQREAEWLKEHTEQPAWRDPDELVTGPDPRFEFAFWPPPPLQFALDARRDGHVPVSARWGSLEPGARLDLGDLPLTAGVRVRGRVVDTHGAAQAKLTVSIYQLTDRNARQDQPAPVRSASAQSNADGSFEMTSPLAPGNYFVSTTNLPLVSPAQFEIALEHPDTPLEVVVKSLADIPRIAGRVLDMDGKPVNRAEVRTDYSRLDSQQERFSATTRRDGSFEIRAERKPKGKSLGLVVQADDCECDAAAREVAWGTTDVEFRVVRGGDLTVRVTDPQGKPVEHYTLRMIPRGQNQSSDDGRVRSQGHHADGVATVPGLKGGDWLVEVEFPAAADCDLLFAPLHLDGPTSVRLDLVARPPEQRPLRVLFADGKPATDTTVRLCDPFGQPLHDYRPILSLDHWHMNAGNPTCLLALLELRTDADGCATLRGPAGRDLVLELTSERHLPQRIEGVRLDTSTELTVRVSAGATLRGRAGPPAALEELRQLAGLEPGAEFHERPNLSLRAREGHASFPPVTAAMAGRAPPLQLADDGTFAAGGIPAGAWVIALQYRYEQRGGSIQVGEVTLTDGATTELDVDLSAILPGTLEGTVLHNGAPFANRRVLLSSAGNFHNAFTDGDGRFTLRAAAGDYTCQVPINWPASLAATAPVTIVRGERRRGEFQVFSGRARLHLLDPDGKPVSQVRLMRRDEADPHGKFLPITDVDGRVTLDLPPGHYTFHALPQKLTTNEEMERIRQEAREAGREGRYGPHLLPLGEVTLQTGDDREVELHLPEAWRQ